MFREGMNLVVLAVLSDESITNAYSLATKLPGKDLIGAFDQKKWLSGDVFEIFIQTDRETYFEFHVTPGNQRLSLAWTAALRDAKKRGDIAIEDIMRGGLIRSRTNVIQERSLWTVVATIPFRAVGIDFDSEYPDLKVAFARYDASADSAPIVLSATPNFPVLDFHQRAFWHRVDFGE